MQDKLVDLKNYIIGDYMKSKMNVWIAKNDMSKREVAEKMGVSRTVLSRWINNKSKPSLKNAFKLADLLGCTVDDLYER